MSALQNKTDDESTSNQLRNVFAAHDELDLHVGTVDTPVVLTDGGVDEESGSATAEDIDSRINNLYSKDDVQEIINNGYLFAETNDAYYVHPSYDEWRWLETNNIVSYDERARVVENVYRPSLKSLSNLNSPAPTEIDSDSDPMVLYKEDSQPLSGEGEGDDNDE